MKMSFHKKKLNTRPSSHPPPTDHKDWGGGEQGYEARVYRGGGNFALREGAELRAPPLQKMYFSNAHLNRKIID